MRRKIFGLLLAISLALPAAHSTPLGIMVAAYFVPGPKWDAMNYAASRVPLIAIMNPASGPGTSQNSSYISALTNLHAAGGKVIGYVSTAYTNRALVDVEADIDKYVAWYAMDGFFIDEMANNANTGHLDYYAAIYQYIKAKGGQYSVTGNPGANTQESYVTRPTADMLMIFENDSSQYPAFSPSSWVTHYSPDHFVHLPYGAVGTTTLTNYVSLAVSRNAGWIYISDLTTYSALPTYWTNEVDLVQSLNAIAAQNLVTNFYTLSSEDFANPERGFYIQLDNKASAPSLITTSLASYRTNGKSSPGNVYTAKISLVLRLFYLDTFVNAPISSNFLNSIQADFNSIRSQGDKAVVRFAYNQDDTRPFDEPTKAQILAHIAQLKPLLQKNSDVIAVLQQGFIAAWGEGYYTDIFYTNGQAKAQHWLDRAEVTSALLDALPPERMIQVRTPQMKQKFVYGPTASSSSAPLSPAAAFNGSNASRLGFHNDCYLASATDYGTFSSNDYGSGTTPQDIINFRNYVAQDTRFTPVGGETCAVNPPTDDCASAGGGADTDMGISHYSFLNQGYNVNVNNDWASQGCMENIKRWLGYRLQLISGRFRTEAQPGQAIPLTLEFQNVGFASPYNPRGLELVLRNTGTGEKFFAALSRDTDVRRWLPGTNYLVNAQLALATNMPAGNYELLLNLPDPAPSLYGMIPYSIRLANSNVLSSAGTMLGDVWEPATGYHRLRHTLTVNGTATNATPNGTEIPVVNFSSIGAAPVSIVDPNQPTDQTVSVGQTVTFNASVNGSVPLSYQWLKNGTNIPAATNASHVITNVQTTDAATYALTVSNPISTNTTRAATLIVSIPIVPVIVIDGSFNDWQSLTPIYSSPSNNPTVTNLKDIYICNDSNFIYLMVTAWSPTVLVSSKNNFYFDTDNNPATGYASRGGSDFLIQNGAGYQQKVGVFNFGSVTNVQFLCAPAGTASQFEFRISRSAANASDGTAVFKTNVINFCSDQQNASFQTINQVPASGVIHYTLVESPLPPPGPLSISVSGGQVTISWIGSATLQTRNSLTSGSWTNIPAATNPFSILPTGTQQYFRLAR
jgi:hypothetical protein